VTGPDESSPDESSPEVSIVTTGHDVADARLHRLCAAFVRAGLGVEVIGLGSAEQGPPGAGALRTSPRGGLAARAVRAVLQPWQARGRVVVLLDPDPIPSAWLRQRLRRALRPARSLSGGGRPVGGLVVDVHEDYAQLLADRAWARGPVGAAARLLVGVATALARRADLTVVADEHVPPLSAPRRYVVRNLPDGGYLPDPSPRDEVPRALHVGDLRRSRGLFAMVAAVAAAPGWVLDLVGPVAAADQGELARVLADSGAADRVRLHGRLPPAQAWALARGAWCGLALLDNTPAFREAMPTKVYEYLGSGLAVAVTPLPRMAALVGDSGAGVTVSDESALAELLRAWSGDPAPLEAMRAAARTWAEEHLRGRSAYDELAEAVAALAR